MSLLTRMSLRNRLIVGMLTAVVALFGVIATTMLNQETMPSVQTPGTYVQASLPGASPDVVEETVTEPLETALSSVAEVDTVTTETTAGSMFATVLWPFEADSEQLFDSVRSAVEGARASLPESAQVEVVSASIDDVPVVQVAVSSSNGGEDLGERLDSVLVPEVQAVAGVQDVTVSGQTEREVRIAFREDDVEEHGVQIATVPEELEAAGVVTPAGESTQGENALAVEVGTAVSSVEEIAQTPIRTQDGTVRLEEIADVALESVEQTTLSRADGEDAVTVSVTKAQDANVVAVSHGVAEALERVRAELGDGVEFSTVFDQAPAIEQSIHDLSVEGGLGLLFAVLVILAFLGSFRTTIVAAISIPLSLLIAMIGLWWGEYTLNILTLGALTIAVGRVVDDSIVVIENIRRRQGHGELSIDDIVASVRQVAGAITASTLTTVAVFLPVAFVSGITGQLFRPFSVTVSLALLASLLVALTIVPTLSYWFLRKAPKPLPQKRQEAADARYEAWLERQNTRAEKRRERAQRRIEKKNRTREKKGRSPLPAAPAEIPIGPALSGEAASPVDALQRRFLPSIRTALRHPGRTIAVSVVIMLLTLVLASTLRTDFLGGQGENTLSVSQTLPVGSSLETSDAAARQLEEVLERDADVEGYVSTINAASGGTPNSITVTLREDADAEAVSSRLQGEFEAVEGAGEVTVGSAVEGLSEDVEIALSGTDLEALSEAATDLTEQLAGIDGVSDARNDLAAEQPVIRVKVDREAAADYGFSQAEVGAAVAAALDGTPAGSITLEGVERDIVIAPTHPDASPEEIAELELPVSERQTLMAQEEAQDELEAEQDARADRASEKAEEDAAEQLAAAREAREQAADQVESLRQQLEDLRNPPAPPDPDEAREDEIEAAEEAIAEAEENLREAEENVDELIAAQEEQRAEQAEEERLAEQQEGIQDITGEPITVDTVAEVSEEQTQASITREDGTRQVTVFATPAPGQLGAVSQAVDELTASTDLPDGVGFAVAGASAEQQESFAQLGFAMLAAIVLVFLIMIATFRSLVQPLILLVSIPFAATGAVVLLVLTGIPLGIPALIGLLMLIGIVVTNAIVLIDLINKLRDQGLDLTEAVIHGTRLRLRPILMTAAATVFALLPMAFGLTGGGIFISQPLAIVVIGGLTSSTLLTLILVPVLYTIAERRKERRRSRKKTQVRVDAEESG